MSGTKIDLEDLERKARRATPGNWTTASPSKGSDGWSYGVTIATASPVQRIYTDYRGGIAVEANRQHIAANSPPVTLALIGRIRELESAAELVLGESGCDPSDECHRAVHAVLAERLARGTVLL
jgi:hypothetical protein